MIDYPKNLRTLFEPYMKVRNETIEATIIEICSNISEGSTSLATNAEASQTIINNNVMMPSFI